jgi:hypothetical protein
LTELVGPGSETIAASACAACRRRGRLAGAREPDYVEVDTGGSPTVSGWFHVQNGGSSGQGQVRLQSDVTMLDWFVSPRSASRQELPLVRQREALQAGPCPWRRSKGRRERRDDRLERPVQHPAVRTPVAHPVRVQGNCSNVRRDRLGRSLESLGEGLTSIPHDYEDEPDEDEEPQDGSRADDSQWFTGQ